MQHMSDPFYSIIHSGSPGIGPGPQGPFQRSMSMEGKPPGGPGGAGRRPMLIKQENMMGSPDGYPGNMGVWRRDFSVSSTLHVYEADTCLRVIRPDE